MVFFRLGKIDKNGTKDGENQKLDESPGRKDEKKVPPDDKTSALNPIDPIDPFVLEKEKKEKKKKAKHSDDKDSLADALKDLSDRGSASSSSTAALGGLQAGGGLSSSSTTRAAGVVPGSVLAQKESKVVGLSVNDFISKTKNQQRQGLKPSGPELIAYARYLGIDPVADHDLLWIAVEALEAPLPSDWTEHFDSNDRVFYYNATMRVSSWTHPLEHIYRETYKTIVNFRNSNMSPQERAEKLHNLQLEVKQMEHDVHKEIAQWTEHTDEQGNRFYFNREERQSTWTDPRPAKCQILYLRMKMLRLLASSTGGVTSGFSEGKGELGSRFAPLVGAGGSELEDPAFKRPKVGAAEGADPSLEPHAGSPAASNAGSDSESEDDKKKKKKKKKKKDKKEKRRDAEKPMDSDRHAAAPPPRLGQNLRNSQSEPTVSGKPHLGNAEEARQSLGGLTPSASASLANLPSFDHASEGLSTVGRSRVKAGIRLEPLGPGGLAALDRPMADPIESSTPKGVRSSASMPSLGGGL